MNVELIIEQFEITCRARTGNTNDLLATLSELETATRIGPLVDIRSNVRGAFDLLFNRAIDAEVLGDYFCAVQLYRTALESLTDIESQQANEQRAHCECGMIRCEMLEEGQLDQFDFFTLRAKAEKYTNLGAGHSFKAQTKFMLLLYLVLASSHNSCLLVLSEGELNALPPQLASLAQLIAAVAELHFGDRASASKLLSELADNDFISYAVPALFVSANALEAAKRKSDDEALSAIVDSLEFMYTSTNPLYDSIGLVCCMYAIGFAKKKQRAAAIAKHAFKLELVPAPVSAKHMLTVVASIHGSLISTYNSLLKTIQAMDEVARRADSLAMAFIAQIGYTLGNDFPSLRKESPERHIIGTAFFLNSKENNSVANDYSTVIALQAMLGRENIQHDADRIVAAASLLAKQLRLAPASIVSLQINILSDVVLADGNAFRASELAILLEGRSLSVDEEMLDSIKRMATALTQNSSRLSSPDGRRSLIDEIGRGTFVESCHMDVWEASLCLLGLLPSERRIADELGTIRKWQQ